MDLFLEIVLALEIALAMWVFYEESGGEGTYSDPNNKSMALCESVGN